MYKEHPQLLIKFSQSTAWFGKEIDIGINKKPPFNMLSIQPPSDENIFYSTEKLEWHFLREDRRWRFINKLNLNIPMGELNYKRANNLGTDLGPWHPYLASNGKIFSPLMCGIGSEVWWIFYFKDNYKGKNQCKCRRFKFTHPNWETVGDQHTNHYRKLLWDDGERICKTCPFKKYINELNKKRDW